MQEGSINERGAAPEMLPASAEAIGRAAARLRAGELVAFPTETVYGLGADALNNQAVAAIFAAKGRPSFNPLIVHVATRAAAEAIAVFDERAAVLADVFWPGPLTLVLPQRPDCGISLLVSAGLGSVALRIPAHPVARALLHEAGCPIAAPSANRSGAVSPTTALHVLESLGDAVPTILAAGKSQIGLESTVLDLTGPVAVLLRPGAVTREDLEPLIGPVALPASDPDPAQGLHSPGMLASHYAPGVPVRLNAVHAEPDEALLAFGPEFGLGGGAARLNLSPEGDLTMAAANLFAMLRALDRAEYRAIAVMPIPERGLGIAINDRLRRAAAPRLPNV